ncbi:MAG TPA: HD domain-containing protein [Candidatus Kapabacteria bacterium]|nr:HD domain-containing protein [Candidatus Kapabacteria bacterium]
MQYINSQLVNEFFRGFHIQRWNDRVRPMDLIEIDKHSHKMLIAFIIAKYEEERGNVIDWNKIINDGIYELLRRIVISDIKSPIYQEIRKNKEVFQKLNEYIFSTLEPILNNLQIKDEFKLFLFEQKDLSDLNFRVMEAAHIYASLWEFQIIETANPKNYQNEKILTDLNNRISPYQDLAGIDKLLNHHTIKNFVDLFGSLRFQLRWAQIPRLPKTSVLGHSLLVAILSFLFARENNASPKRLYNAFWGGLFHDLPEAATRDIISPVKTSSAELDNLIKSIETDLAENEIYPLLEPSWVDEIKYFVENEFANKIINNSNQIEFISSTEEMNSKYNYDSLSPYDGQLIRAADRLAAFLEAYHSCNVGISPEELKIAGKKIKEENIDKVFGNVILREIYSSY